MAAEFIKYWFSRVIFLKFRAYYRLNVNYVQAIINSLQAEDIVLV